MASADGLAPDGRPHGGPLNKTCSICQQPRGALAESALPGGSSETDFKGKAYPYYICSNCDRDTLEMYVPPSVDGRGSE